MQFFPADITSLFSAASPVQNASVGVSTSNGIWNSSTYSYADAKNGSSRTFADVFDGSLSAYNVNNSVGIPFGFRSVRDDGAAIKSADLLNLSGILKKQGVDSDTVDGFMEQFNTLFGGATVGALNGTAERMINRKTPQLNEQELLAFNTLLYKLGFKETQIDELENAVYQGRGIDVLAAIQENIAEGEFTLNLDEVALICRAADLSGDAGKAIMSNFKDERELAFDQDVFKQFFGPTLASLQEIMLNLKELRAALPDAIKEMISTRAKEKDLPSADNRSSRLSERAAIFAAEYATSEEEDEDEDGPPIILRKSAASRLLDADAAQAVAEQENARTKTGKSAKGKLNAQAVANAEARTGNKSATRDGTREHARVNPGSIFDNAAMPEGISEQETGKKVPDAAHNAAAPRLNAKNASPVQDKTGILGEAAENARGAETGNTRHTEALHAETGVEGRSHGDGKGAPEGQEHSARHQGNLYQNSNGQSESRKDARSVLAGKIENVDGAFFTPVLNSVENSSLNSGETQQYKNLQQFQEKIFEQVEKGLVRSLNDGAKQMVLRLDPPELGKLTLSLTMAQGEIKAVIRTESAAATQVISEQLVQLKQTLEEQGFKVAGLEVETRANQHAGTDNWNGAEQHNQQQEMEEKSRFTRMARLRNTEGGTLAQSMQHIAHPASISASGLHLIA